MKITLLVCSTFVAGLTCFGTDATIPPVTPQIQGIFPHGIRRGGAVELIIRGRNLQNTHRIHFRSPRLQAEVLESTAYLVRAKIRAAADAELGRHDIRLIAAHGSVLNWFDVSDRAESLEKEPNDDRAHAQPLAFPALVNGVVKAKDYDYFRFDAKAGETLVFDLLATRNGSPFDGVLSLLDSTGEEVEYSDDYYSFKDPHIVFRVEKDGAYYLRVYGTGESGSDTSDYRLIAGAAPHVYFAMPAGGKAGDTVDVTLNGVNLEGVRKAVLGDGIASAAVANGKLRLTLPMDLKPGEYKLHAEGASLPVPFVIGQLPELTPARNAARNRQDPLPISLGVTINGSIDKPRAADYFTFRVNEPKRVLLEANSMRIGFLLDPLVLLYDESGKRIAWQDEPTTNTGKEPADMDPHLVVDLPRAGRYTAVIRDAQFRGMPEFAYRLTVKEAAPDFTLRVVGTSETLYRARTNIVNVRVRRLEGWNTPVEVCAGNLPPGVTAECVIAEPKNTEYKGTCGETHYLDGANVEIPLKVAADAPASLSQIRFRGRGVMGGRQVERSALTRYWKSRIKLIGDSEEQDLYATVFDAPGAVIQTPERASTGPLTVIVTRIVGGEDPLRIEAEDGVAIDPVELGPSVTRADIRIKNPGKLVLVSKLGDRVVGRSHPITVGGNK